MMDVKVVQTPLTSHLKLYKDQCSKTDKKWYLTLKIPCTSFICVLMYVTTSTRTNIAHEVYLMSVCGKLKNNNIGMPPSGCSNISWEWLILAQILEKDTYI